MSAAILDDRQGVRSIMPAMEDPGPRVADPLRTAARRHPEKPALVVTADRIQIGYRDLVRLVDDLAARLTDGGLRPGDRAGLRAPSSAEFVVGLLAASAADLVVVPLDPALPVAEQRERIAATGARIVLTDEAGETGEASLPCWPISVAPGVHVDLDNAEAPYPAGAAPDGLRPDDAMIMFTGGTTGSPKMVPWTRDNIASSVEGVIATYGLGPNDATVAVMPLFHGHGLIAALLSSLASGGSVLLPAGGRFSAHTFADDVAAAHATWFTAVPTIHRILLQHGPEQASADRRAPLRFIRSCSAALSPETAQALQAEFGAPVRSAYGMTEATHQVTSTTDNQDDVTAGLVGRSTGARIRIVGDDGRPCPSEVVGQVWLRGRTVVRGYLGDSGVTAQTFTDGWLHTGDLGSLSAEGELTLRGRIKELINRGGEKISPERVEAALANHPNVLEAAVFGVPDALYGETVAALIVADPAGTPTAAELAEFCRERLAGFEIPSTVVAATELPHTAKGSVDRRAAAEQFGKDPPR
jgi:acyl-CoA synthetase (AMP-forming)/AMP-acid ligase II